MNREGHVGPLVAQLEAHVPRDAREERSRRRALAIIERLPSPLDEHADPCHVTASAIVLDEVGQVLLLRHKRLGVWLQPGGHVDPGETVAEAALRETREETGIDCRLDERAMPLHVDVHDGPRGHLHVDVRYLVRAPADAVVAPEPGESTDVAFFAPSRALDLADDRARSAIRAALSVTGGSARASGGPPHHHP